MPFSLFSPFQVVEDRLKIIQRHTIDRSLESFSILPITARGELPTERTRALKMDG